MEQIKKLREIIDNSKNIVAFTGAGISTLSGIKDFRSPDGLYNMKYKYPPEEILSHSFFFNNTEEFFKFYKDKMYCSDKKPNIVHNYLTSLEKKGKLKAIVTQNIDYLHEKSGSKNVINLHGTVYKNKCTKCNKNYPPEKVFNSDDVPKCICGGIIKPEVVLYEEPLDEQSIKDAIYYIENADTLLVLGTSLTVYPASNFINYFKGKNLVIINNTLTSFDKLANLVIHDDLKNVFEKL